jgi:hypothetical protein
VERQLAGAWRVVAAYRTSDGAMIGYARAMSDGEASAYLADVFVVEEACGLGVGKTSPPPRIKSVGPDPATPADRRRLVAECRHVPLR